MELYLAILNAKGVCHLCDRLFMESLALEQQHIIHVRLFSHWYVNLEQTDHGLHIEKVLDLKANFPL